MFFIEKLSTKLKNTATKYTLQPGDTLYVIRDKDTLDKIAARFKVNPKTLADLNSLKRSKLPSTGSKIIIPTHARPRKEKYQLSSGDTIYMVRNGDTIERIAQKFNTSPSALRLVNFLSNNIIHEGDQLMIPTHV